MLYLDDLDLYATASQVQEKYTASVLPNPDLRAEDLIELREFFLRSPSLGGPPDIFFAVIQGTQLARLTRPLTMEEYFVASSHYHRVQEWELKLDSIESQVDDQNLWMAKPYSLAVRVLILIVLTSNAPANDPRRQQLVSTLKEASAFLGKMEHYFHRTWGKYLLWPLAVLGATFTEPDELNEIRRLFDKMVARSNSSTILPVRRVLEDQIWSRQTEEGSSFRAQGIPSLFNCKLMAETAENLLQEASLAHASMLSTFMARLSSLNH